MGSGFTLIIRVLSFLNLLSPPAAVFPFRKSSLESIPFLFNPLAIEGTKLIFELPYMSLTIESEVLFIRFNLSAAPEYLLLLYPMPK